MTWQVWGLTFHAYGLIIGVATLLGVLAVEYQARRHGVTEAQFWGRLWVPLLGGIIGARLWHVATDWWLYQSNFLAIFFIWNGGMSILGAVLGAMLALWAYQIWRPAQVSLATWADLSIFGLPVAQAIGRWGNYFNQELYGLPSSLPWAITIDASNRVAQYAQLSSYHPLFLYEMIFTAGFAVWLWVKGKAHFKIGTGKLFELYILYYSVVRFCLDFLRVEKPQLWYNLGVNQVILLLVIGILLTRYVKLFIRAAR